MYQEIYFKELAHVITGADMSKILRAGQQVEIQARVDFAVWSLKFTEQTKRCFYVLLLPLETCLCYEGLPLVR